MVSPYSPSPLAQRYCCHVHTERDAAIEKAHCHHRGMKCPDFYQSMGKKEKLTNAPLGVKVQLHIVQDRVLQPVSEKYWEENDDTSTPAVIPMSFEAPL